MIPKVPYSKTEQQPESDAFLTVGLYIPLYFKDLSPSTENRVTIDAKKWANMFVERYGSSKNRCGCRVSCESSNASSLAAELGSSVTALQLPGWSTVQCKSRNIDIGAVAVVFLRPLYT
jgi:hypothetical protein